MPFAADRLVDFKNHYKYHRSGGLAGAAVRRWSSRRRHGTKKSTARARTRQRVFGVMQQQPLGRACAIGAATAVAGAYHTEN